MPERAELRAWIREMKQSPRGPFARVRWFCADGTRRPARAGCAGHGGGLQHGEWNERARRLRRAGFRIANVLADLEPEPFVGDGGDLDGLGQILIERFLVELDEGWIFRGVRTYRGALQAEDEEAGARRLLRALVRDRRWWSDERFYLLREAYRLLPRERAGEGVVTAADVRREARWIAARDRGFAGLRNKLHGAPDPGDAERVRRYARERGLDALAAHYLVLADDIERLYSTRPATAALRAVAAEAPGGLRRALEPRVERLAAATDAFDRLRLAGQIAALVRRDRAAFEGTRARLDALAASLAAEREMYLAASELSPSLARATRSRRLAWLRGAIDGLYGTGLVGRRQALALRASIARLQAAGTPSVGDYRSEARYLERAVGWAADTISYYLEGAIERLAVIEPKARLYVQERLRASPFLFFGTVADAMLADANRLAGLEHRVFGRRVGSGVRALNPGLARGVLRLAGEGGLSDLAPDGIYLLREAVAELPPVAGVLTREAGGSLSHVQILARSLGVPNAVVSADLLEILRAHEGERVALAVGRSGVVWLGREGELPTAWRPRRPRSGSRRPPPDLDERRLLSLDELRSEDAGRVVGPKSANLGELRRRFGDRVPPGFAIPFGAFRRALERPFEPGGEGAWAWLRAELGRARGRATASARVAQARAALARLRAWIESAPFDPGLEAEIRRRLRSLGLGRRGVGVFVRSDTDAEDSAGFSGAGLNLTVPNVVADDDVLDAIRRVWASPFEERAFAWRAAYLDRPERVLPAVLVQRAFPAEKSGVLVTADPETGARGTLTVATNWGVGGAVAGQRGELLRVDRATGAVRLLARATARRRRVLSPSGGLRELPAPLEEAVLEPTEIRALLAVAAEIEDLPALRTPGGERMPADVEFAFARGRLALLQVRPFVIGGAPAELDSLGAAFARRQELPVRLDAVPGRDP